MRLECMGAETFQVRAGLEGMGEQKPTAFRMKMGLFIFVTI